MSGTKLNAVQYKGAAPALTDVIAGHVPMMFVSTGLIVQPWKAGQLRPLGVGSRERLAQFPELPTVAETLPGFTALVWFGLFAPSGTPRDIVVKINNAVQRILADRDFRDRFLTPNLYEPMPGSPEQFAEQIRLRCRAVAEGDPRCQAGDRGLTAPAAKRLRVTQGADDQAQCEIIQGRAAGKLLAPFLPRLVLRVDLPPQHEQPAPCAAFI